MTDFVWFVFTSGGFVVSALVAALWLALRPHAKAARRFLLAVVLFYTLISIYAVGYVLTLPLLAGYHPLTAADVPPGRTAVVVLGSGGYSIWDWSENEFSDTEPVASSRVIEAVRVFNLVSPAWVISSGGKVHNDDVGRASAETMAVLLRQLGVPADRIITQSRSRTTHEEAVINVEIVRNLKADHLIVVTTDYHMRRSVGAFRAAGIEVIPAIARDPYPARDWHDWILPGDFGFWRSSALAHEVFGIAYYALRGWYKF